MSKLPDKQAESLGGTVVHNLPFPDLNNPQALAWLKEMAPIVFEQPYSITYQHSYAQDSPWFAGLTNKKLLANRDPETGYTYATPRGHDMFTGKETEWIDITTRNARVHAFTVCHFGSEEFLDQTPFVLILVEFEGVDTLLLSRLLGVDPHQAALDWIGMQVKPRFLRNSKLKPTDVYFVPREE
ncbi:MAG: Zn-ribbon domain-containing OB-fold protein [Anaerolineales bacterium]|nr:Zn-ribbon domain-containing OB-fold protein [Anaerolineales bacterium]